MSFKTWKTVAENTVRDIDRNHTAAFAAGLAYYFVLSLFPALILLATVLVLSPVPDLYGRILTLLSRVVPADGMGLIRRISASVISPNRRTLLSFGIVGVLWSTCTGFVAVIEALNVAYNVLETRPFWRTRMLALLMAMGVGGLLLLALLVQVVGPDFGRWLARNFGLGPVLRVVWPYLRWGVTAAFTVVAILATYKAAPNIRQSIRQVLPGALVATVFWIVLSFGIGFYFRSFAHFNKTYGALGAAVALMVWLYYSGFVILIGASVNSQLMQLQGDVQPSLKRPRKVQPQPASKTEPGIAA